MNKSDVGILVRTHRAMLRLSQTYVANKAKISQGKLSKVENGLLDLSVSEFERVMKVYGIKLVLKEI